MVDISQEKILMQQNFTLILGVPYDRVSMSGAINSTNKDYLLPAENAPVYPMGKLKITPSVSDLTVEGLKSATYTILSPSALKTVTDSNGNSYNAGVSFSAAPTAAAVDSIVASGVAQITPVICQSFEPSIKQKEETVGAIGTTQVIYGYGSITQSIKSTMISSVNSMELAKQIFNQPYDGSESVETGYDATVFSSAPKELYAFMAITDPQTDDIVGFYKFEQCMAKPDMMGIKDGKAGEFTLDFTVAADPILLTPQVEGSSLIRSELSMGAYTGAAGAAVTNLTAVLTDGNDRLVSGKSVAFTINGQSAGSATTNADGIATLTTYTPNPTLSAGSYALIASFAGDTTYAGSVGENTATLS